MGRDIKRSSASVTFRSPVRTLHRHVRTLCCLAAALVVGAASSGTSAIAAEGIQTSCQTGILMDADSQSILFDKEPELLAAPASTAKLMTAELVFRQIKAGKLTLDDTFEISENAWRTGGAMAGGSAMFAVLHSKIRVEDLIRGLVIQSGNDAAIALAEGLAGTEDAFARMMTDRARELGLSKSTFTNPWGRGDPEQRVTVREMALLAGHVVHTYPDLYKYFGEKEFTWNKIRQMNRNPLLFMDIGADGLKTGNITENAFALVGSALQGDQRLIVALNNCRTAKERAEEGRKLLLWGFRNFDRKPVFAANEIVGTARVYGGARGDLPLVADGPIVIFSPRGSSERLIGKIVYEGPIPAPIEKGTRVATLKVTRGQNLVLEAPLRAAESIAVGTLPHRAMDAGLELSATLINRYILRK
jgi:D-alanyl-D-alanine carboxypeptidase (penicillin-binding protein 5/6)